MTFPRTLAATSTRWLILTGILMVIAGLVAIAVPFLTGLAVATYIGFLLLLGGILHLVLAFHLRSAGALLYQLLVAILYFVGGFWILKFPLAGLLAVTTLLAFYLLFASLTEFAVWFGVRLLGGGAWVLLAAIVNLLLALMIFTHLGPSAVWVPGTLIGFVIFWSGFSRLMLGITARRLSTAAA
jgi:uncharacterized membrane protein HdeD (DUF308 family)